ncbi:MAG: hypothetical protein WD341_01390 [Tistlia sp.]|uniref:hypothetical protein n=1 Tax=Tistlia sp. TaxID=3057121 RepID=UPI0034A54305
MTSVTPLSIPASGVSARPSPAFGDARAARAIEPVEAPRQRRPGEDAAGRRGTPDGAPLPTSLAAPFLAPPLSASETADSRSPLEQASEAYRKAGAEPTRYSEAPRLFSVRV